MLKFAIKSVAASAATIVVGAASLSLAAAATPSDMKMTPAQCNTLWSEALAGSAGELSMALAKPYVHDFQKADANSNKTLSQGEWTDACKAGGVRSAALNGASNGANASPDKTSDRTPGDPSPSRTPGATDTGAAGTEAGQTPSGTSDRTPTK